MLRHTFATILLWATAASAENCAERARAVQFLETDYGETAQSRGLSAEGLMVEMWANPETGTWTMLVTGPDGVSCIIADGFAWDRVDEPPGERM
jgi:hypothetical protein